MIRVYDRKESTCGVLLPVVLFRIAKWTCATKEFSDIEIDHIIQILGACLKSGAFKKKRKVSWLSPLLGVLKFNVDEVARGKPGLVDIGGVQRNHKGKVMLYVL